MPDPILVQRDGPRLTITLNRPDKRNALDGETVGALTGALRNAAEDDALRVVVITGAGTAFSAGADLAALQGLQSASAEANRADSERLALLFETIYQLPQAVIAKVNGHAIAGGCGLAAVCDFSLAADHARLGFTEVRIGFVPAVVSVFVRRKLGDTASRDLLLRGHLLSAPDAARIGLITRSVPAQELDAAVDTLSHEISSETSRTAVATTKQLLAMLPGMGLREALDHAATVNALARSTSDCRAGVQAFLDKTDPPWKASSRDEGTRA